MSRIDFFMGQCMTCGAKAQENCKCHTPSPEKQPSAVREYAIDWNYQGGISVRDLRDGIPVAEWEEHVVEASALAELQEKCQRLEMENKRALIISKSMLTANDDLKRLSDQWREAAEKLAGALNSLPRGRMHDVAYRDCDDDAVCYPNCPACAANKVVEEFEAFKKLMK